MVLAAIGCAAVFGACKAADRIVGLDIGAGNKTITASVGDLVDIRLYGGATGVYEAEPAISSAAVSFISVTRDGAPTASQPTQKYLFRFRAASVGTAVVRFATPSATLVYSDTIVVR